tara:strand:- start:871 stop:1272 length:402 start_codon:yes stop_codon:yes gene_type:complete
MPSIQNREDISQLVHCFYAKVRIHPVLGPIFNHHIAADEWPSHLEKLTDFWESNLFGVSKFRGSPSAKHIKVDRQMNHQISQKHFGLWLQLWLETIDELYEGEMAQKAKSIAQKMATGQYLTIWSNRAENKPK